MGTVGSSTFWGRTARYVPALPVGAVFYVWRGAALCAAASFCPAK